MDAIQKFYDHGKFPADAVALAIADHRGGAMPSFEFIDALNKTQAMCELFAQMNFALRAVWFQINQGRVLGATTAYGKHAPRSWRFAKKV